MNEVRTWTGNSEVDAAIVMLDRIDCSPEDDSRVDAVEATLRRLYARVQERSVRHWWSDGQPHAGVVDLVQRLDATMQDETMLAIERVHTETKERGQVPEEAPMQTHNAANLCRARSTMRVIGYSHSGAILD